MMRVMVAASAILLFLLAPLSAAPPPAVTKAADGIFNAFHAHPLVGLGEWHGLAQELDFYGALIRDPRFAAEIGNLVFEMGDAAQQDTIDRYVNGENVPYTELRKVWADTVGAAPTVLSIGTINVFETVRAVNAKLPPERRIKIWLGDPPIDWPNINTKEEWLTLANQRESYPANLIIREILDKNKKALVIYGTAHFNDHEEAPGTDNLRGLVEKGHPGSWFIVLPYAGYASSACSARFEKHIEGWPTPALVSPVRGSSLEADILPSGCGVYPRAKDETEAQYALHSRDVSGLTADALLYLGPRAGMWWSPNSPDIWLDLDYRAELDRRSMLRFGRPIEGFGAADNPSRAVPYFRN